VFVETSRGGLTGSLLDGRYRIGSVIARGGMSTVYRGLDTRLDRPVAVKVMAAQYAHDAAFLTRFSREARLAAGLSHPGVVAVHDHGRDGDHVFLVMELVDGGTLRDLLHQRGPLPIPVAVAILEPLLTALSAAHRAGLVHRDVKPENVLISAHGTIKVADFGLVRAVTSQTMATGDVILGTVAYLSPEQVRTGASDARSDVYSAGIVGWEMLAGEPPFTGENSLSVAYQHVHSEVPPIGDMVAGVPALLEDLLEDATRRDPAQRPRDAGAFAARLGTVRGRSGIPRVPVPVPSRPRPARPTDDPAAVIPHAGRTTGVGGSPTAVAGQAGPGFDVTAGRSAGPRGTRVVGAAGPPTAVQPRGPGPYISPPSGPPATADRGPAPVRRRRWLRTIIWLVVILLFGVALAAAGWWIGDGRWAYAPSTVGLTQQSAERAIRQAGLIPQVAIAADVAPLGTVARTQPGAGARLLRGSPVDVVVSAGLPVQVPEVAGKSLEDARNKLIVAGLIVGQRIERFDGGTPDGTVLGTEPVAGARVARGGLVKIVVNAGVLVPDVRGGTIEQATATLVADGYQVRVGAPQFDAAVDAGHVIGTEPTAGSRIDPAQRSITLFPSSAVTVPDVTAGNLEQAKQTLGAAGLDYQISGLLQLNSSDVIDQSPGAGQRVEPGTTVFVTALP